MTDSSNSAHLIDLARELQSAFEQGIAQERERAAAVVDRCNREGPYNAIGAAKRIRAGEQPLVSDEAYAELMRLQFGDALTPPPSSEKDDPS